MSTPFEPRDELTERLRDLGRRPVDPALQSEHLTAMAGVRSGASLGASIASRVKLATAVFGGFLLGATGLASAGAMGPLQPVAETTIEAVTPFELPAASDKGQATARAARDKNPSRGKGAEDKAGEGPGAPKNWEGCATTFGGEPASRRNRGQYLKDAREHGTPAEFEAARRSDCGKSLGAGDDGETEAEGTAPGGEGSGAPTEPKEGSGPSPDKREGTPPTDAPRGPKAPDAPRGPKVDDGAETETEAGEGAEAGADAAKGKPGEGDSPGRSGVRAPSTTTPGEVGDDAGPGTDRRGGGRGPAGPAAPRP